MKYTACMYHYMCVPIHRLGLGMPFRMLNDSLRMSLMRGQSSATIHLPSQHMPSTRAPPPETQLSRTASSQHYAQELQTAERVRNQINTDSAALCSNTKHLYIHVI